MKQSLVCCFAIFISISSGAQLLTWTPHRLVKNYASTNVVVPLDVAGGNRSLLSNASSTNNLYFHNGVITILDSSATSWLAVQAFGIAGNLASSAPIPQLPATYIANKKCKFTITASLRNYFVTTDGSEHTRLPGEFLICLSRNAINAVIALFSKLAGPANFLLAQFYPHPVLKTFQAHLYIPVTGLVEMGIFNLPVQSEGKVFSSIK